MSASIGVPGRSSGAARVKAKLKMALEAGDYYEAHQMYRTLYFRLSSAQKFADLEPLLYEGALLFLRQGQVGSGVDLTRAYLDVLIKGQVGVTESPCQRVAQLYALVPENHAEKDGLMATAIQWSTRPGSTQGHPRVHQLVAHHLWRSQRYAESRHHFLLSCDGQGCGSMLVEFHIGRGYPSEVDLFVVGTILQLICLKKHLVAAMTLKTYTEAHPSIRRGPPYGHPLLNFVWLLLLAIDTKQSLAVFSILIEKYKRCLDRDPNYFQFVDKIGQSFFGLPPPRRNAQPNLFSGLFDQMFSAFNDDDNSDSDESASHSGPSQGARASNTRAAKPGPKARMETEDLD